MKTKFNKKHLTLAILSMLLPAANGNTAETVGVSVGSAMVPGPKTPKTRLVSVNLAGTASGNKFSFLGIPDNSTSPMLSADGRFVAFYGLASDLVTNDTNGVVDAFVRDLKTGRTTLVSINSAGTASANGYSFSPVLSAEGRFVAFYSEASDLITNDTNGKEDVFVRDLKTGTTTLASVNSAGTASGNGRSFVTALSADGRFVAFFSHASDLVANDINGVADTFVRDLKTGTTTLVSVNSAGTGSGNDFSDSPVLSADGRFVAFYGLASDLATDDTNGTGDVFVRDLKTGRTALASVNSAGTASGNNDSLRPLLSADGHFVAFYSFASDLVENDTNSSYDVFVRDLKTGTTTLVSINSTGTASGNGISVGTALSANGRFVSFRSLASDLVANDTNGTYDIFVRDLKTGMTTLVSVNNAGTASGNGQSSINLPALSADGRFVAFDSYASDLIANDTNGTTDVFVRPTQLDREREDQSESDGDKMQDNGKLHGRFTFR